MVYRVLQTSQAEDWKKVLDEAGGADIYYSPEYCKIAENNNEGSARLFVYEEEGGLVCYPFLMKPIRNLCLPAARQINRDLYDIVTPYGYGGPIANASDEWSEKELLKRFAEVFGSYCQETGIVTEFIRFHPILQNHGHYQAVNPTKIRNTVCIDLTKDVMESLTKNCRNRVRYAQKHGLVVMQRDREQLNDFLGMYYATMDKNNANTYYYFSEDYFRDFVRLLKDHITLFEVRYDGRVIASAFFLQYNEYVSYHLTGSIQEYLPLAPYNLLIAHAAQWYKEKNCKYLHLGGGYKGNDELFRFKSTFIKQDPLDFYIGRKVHSPDLYEQFSRGVRAPDDYFPVYRHPSLSENSCAEVDGKGENYDRRTD